MDLSSFLALLVLLLALVMQYLDPDPTQSCVT